MLNASVCPSLTDAGLEVSWLLPSPVYVPTAGVAKEVMTAPQPHTCSSGLHACSPCCSLTLVRAVVQMLAAHCPKRLRHVTVAGAGNGLVTRQVR